MTDREGKKIDCRTCTSILDTIETFTICFEDLNVQYDEVDVLQSLIHNPYIVSIKIEIVDPSSVFSMTVRTCDHKLFAVKILGALHGVWIKTMFFECTPEMWDHKIINIKGGGCYETRIESFY